MTRRDVPRGTSEESQRDIERMKRTLQLRTRGKVSIASGPASQEAGEVRGVPLAGKTPTINGTGSSAPTGDASASGGVGDGQINAGVAPARTQPSLTDQQELLGRLTAAPPLPVDPQGPAPPIKAITAAPVIPAGYVDAPPKLEWLSPITHANGEKTQISQGGAYEVLGRRTPGGFVFIAKHGLDSLGASKVAAENAREMCQRHYEKACGADHGT